MKPGAYITITLLLIACPAGLRSQDSTSVNSKIKTWLILQAVPSFSWTVFPAQTNFAFEWRATPVLYSFGMTKLDPPWHFFFVNPPERFAGSIELNITGQIYPSSIGSTHVGWSGQLLGHLPLIEMGEYLGLNVGGAVYRFNNKNTGFAVAGISTLFGFVHWNTKYAPQDRIWMTSLELRFF
ncbi:MAG TPA: hypothetical protein VI758_06125 [Bacteroidota bacterium]